MSIKIDLNLLFKNTRLNNIGFAQFYLHEFTLVLSKMYHVIFYTMTEVYGALVLSYCFWTFVNTYTSIKKASLLYPQYVVFSSFSTIISGIIGITLPYFLSLFFGNSPAIYNRFSSLLNISICVFSMLSSVYFYSISLRLHKLEAAENEEKGEFKEKKRPKTSFLQSILSLAQNKIILCLFLCVVSYMTCINLVEITWKKMSLNYCKSLGNSRMWFDIILGCSHLGIGLTTIFMSPLCTHVILKFGWVVAAMVNPILIGLTGVLFFFIIQFDYSFRIGSFVVSSLLLSVFIGMIQNIASKTCKYSFFDSTKEIGFLYLSKEDRDKGKSAIDMLGGRLGKSLGSVIQQVLLACFVSYDQLHLGQEIIQKYIGFMLIFIVIIWSIAVTVIGAEIKTATQKISKNNTDEDNSTK